jgi:hypothetical protein
MDGLKEVGGVRLAESRVSEGEVERQADLKARRERQDRP